MPCVQALGDAFGARLVREKIRQRPLRCRAVVEHVRFAVFGNFES